MSITFPEAFKERMEQNLGAGWPAFEAAHDLPSPVSIRLNPLKSAAYAGEKVPWSEFGYYLNERPSFTLDPSFHGGAYYVQEASSMFLEQAVRQLLPRERPLIVLDLCAAPGGKSTHILSLLNEESLLVSNEIIRSRTSILSENIQKWGYPNVVVTQNDPEDFSGFYSLFDAIIVDAPCSGEGLFRKDRNAMNEWSERNVELCSARQKRILEAVWPCLKQDGTLIYSTCTYNETENEENMVWLSEQRGCVFRELNLEAGSGPEKSIHGNTIGYRFLPHKTKGEGFFLCAVTKTEHEGTVTIRSAKNSFTKPGKKTRDLLKEWLNGGHDSLILRKNLVQYIPEGYHNVLEFLSARLHIVYAGTFLATEKQNKIVPEHALALSSILNKNNFPRINLSLEQALQYLRKENLTPDHGITRGFALACWQDLPIGWMNLLQGRTNNLYPAEWRIRMK